MNVFSDIKIVVEKKLNVIILRVTSILAVISFFVILIIGLDFRPLLFEIDNEAQAIRCNNVLINLASSYLTGYIVYVLTVLLPHLLSKQSFKHIIKNKYRLIQDRLKFSVRCVYPYPDNDVDSKKLIRKDDFLDRIESISLTDPCLILQGELHYDVITYLVKQRESIEQIIDQLLSFYREYLTNRQLVHLEEIREHEYFRALTTYKTIDRMNEPVARRFLGEQIFDLYEKTRDDFL